MPIDTSTGGFITPGIWGCRIPELKLKFPWPCQLQPFSVVSPRNLLWSLRRSPLSSPSGVNHWARAVTHRTSILLKALGGRERESQLMPPRLPLRKPKAISIVAHLPDSFSLQHYHCQSWNQGFHWTSYSSGTTLFLLRYSWFTVLG